MVLSVSLDVTVNFKKVSPREFATEFPGFLEESSGDESSFPDFRAELCGDESSKALFWKPSPDPQSGAKSVKQR
jgi:hypothetical protein